MHPKAALVALAACSALTLGACTSTVGGAEPSAQSSSADEAENRPTLGGDAAAVALVQSAIATSDALEAVHFVLRTTGAIDRLQVVGAEGNLTVKPRTAASGTATVKAGGHTPAKFVLIDDTMYADIGGKGFVAHRTGDSFYDVAALFSPTDGIPDILRHLQSAAVAGEGQIDGIATTRIAGTAPAADIAELAGVRTAHGATSPQTPVTIWIQKDAPHHVVRISGVPQSAAEVEVTLSKWGEKVSVTAPSARPMPTGAATATPPGVSGKPKKN